MPLRSLRRAAALVLLSLCTACMPVPSYLDADYEHNLVAAPAPPAQVPTVTVLARFTVNGQPDDGLSGHVAHEVVTLLRESSLMMPVKHGGELRLKLWLDDSADLDRAEQVGFRAGRSMGKETEPVEDHYSLRFVLEDASGQERSSASYKVTMTTLLGGKADASLGKPRSSRACFEIILRNSLYSFLGGVPRS